jgi:hypothetical protein
MGFPTPEVSRQEQRRSLDVALFMRQELTCTYLALLCDDSQWSEGAALRKTPRSPSSKKSRKKSVSFRSLHAEES